MRASFQTQSVQFTSYRNIATCTPSQNIFDDLIDPTHFAELQRQENATSGIAHGVEKHWRVFQYGEQALSLYVFEKLNWKRGRFSNGLEYGVWYGALEEETSKMETLYYWYGDAREKYRRLPEEQGPIIYQRVMVKAACQAAKMVDLRAIASWKNSLIGEDHTFCQALGRRAVQEGIEVFFTPSARCSGGTCTPVFQPQVILQDGYLYAFDFIVYRNLKIQIRKSQISDIKVPKEWQEAR